MNTLKDILHTKITISKLFLSVIISEHRYVRKCTPLNETQTRKVRNAYVTCTQTVTDAHLK